MMYFENDLSKEFNSEILEPLCFSESIGVTYSCLVLCVCKDKSVIETHKINRFVVKQRKNTRLSHLNVTMPFDN